MNGSDVSLSDLESMLDVLIQDAAYLGAYNREMVHLSKRKNVSQNAVFNAGGVVQLQHTQVQETKKKILASIQAMLFRS